MTQNLRISLVFPGGVYSGAELGLAEELPSPARIHEAFTAAAAGGPAATAAGRVLVADDDQRRAVEWLEGNEPVAIIPPRTRMTSRHARRYRWRASPVTLADTDFEPQCVLDGPIIFLWPQAPAEVVTVLAEIAREVTHVGRADSVVIARAEATPEQSDPPETLRVASGRGPGRVMRVAAPGRFAELERAHAEASRPGSHGTGPLGKQAPDERVTGANQAAIVLRRFAPPAASLGWPFAEVWQLPVTTSGTGAEALGARSNRVAAAVGIHRALISAIGSDVPSFVTGRGADGPLRGGGHLAVHIIEADGGTGLVALLALPHDTIAADRERLAAVLRVPLRACCRVARGRDQWFSLGMPTKRTAMPFWREHSSILRTEVPLVLEATGGPRRGHWTLEDAVVCSVGYAMRAVLERSGLGWDTGWAFRQHLVESLRNDHGVVVRVRPVRASASRFVHKVGAGDLVVAVDADVELGDLAPAGCGFLALGRARHLGGGLLRPVSLMS